MNVICIVQPVPFTNTTLLILLKSFNACFLAAITTMIQHREHQGTTSPPTQPTATPRRSIFIKSADYLNPENYVYKDLSSLYVSHDDTAVSSLSLWDSNSNATTSITDTIAVCKLHPETQRLNHFPHFMQPVHQCIDYWIQLRQQLNQRHLQYQALQAILLYDDKVATNLIAGLETSEFIRGNDKSKKPYSRCC
jgi:hypothetical protein